MTVPATPFAKWMRRTRNEQGLTQDDLARAAERQLGLDAQGKKQTMSVSFMSNLENGRRDPTPDKAQALAVGLGKPRDMGLFLAGYVPTAWLQVEADDEVQELANLEMLFGDLNRLVAGAEVVVRTRTSMTEEPEGEEPDLSKVPASAHLSGKPDGSKPPE